MSHKGRHQLQTGLGALAGAETLTHQQRAYRQILHDLELYLSDPAMQAVKDEAYPFLAGRSEDFYAGRTPFNVLWPIAIEHLIFVRAMPPSGPYHGLSPVRSTVGQLQSWSKIIGSDSWTRRYDAVTASDGTLDPVERKRRRTILKAQRAWVNSIDPIARTSVIRSLLAPLERSSGTTKQCQDTRWNQVVNPKVGGSGNWQRDVVGWCNQTRPVQRRQVMLSLVGGSVIPDMFPFTYSEIAEVDPFAYRNLKGLELNFSERRFRLPSGFAYTLSAWEALGIEQQYAGLFRYVEQLQSLISQLHGFASATVIEQFGDQLVSVILLLHRERRKVFDFVKLDAFPDID